MPPGVTTHRITTADGLTLVVDELGDGPPLLFAHGLTSCRAQSHRQLAHMANKYRVVVFDQRGHAESSPITSAVHITLGSLADDIRLILNTLRIDRAYIGGESMGAASALRFALSHPNLVLALVLSLPALANEPLVMRNTIYEMGASIRTLGIQEFALRNAQESIVAGMPASAAASWADVLRSHNTASIALACELVADWLVYDDDRELDVLTMPVHIIARRDDTVHPLELAQRLHRRIVESTLTILDPTQRYFTEPQSVGDDIKRFLDSCTSLPHQ